jgi:hypothetical protein
MFNRCATAGVTPTVVAAGRSGCWPNTGRAVANCWAGIGRATAAIGRDPTIAAAGTEVAARRLTKLLTVMLLIVVTLVT